MNSVRAGGAGVPGAALTGGGAAGVVPVSTRAGRVNNGGRTGDGGAPGAALTGGAAGRGGSGCVVRVSTRAGGVNGGRTGGATVPGAVLSAAGAAGRAAGGVAGVCFSQGSLASILCWAGGGVDGATFWSP